MRAGKLDRTIIVQRQTESVSPAGTVTLAWSDLVTIRAELLRSLLADQMAQAGEGQGASITFRTRFVPDLTVADRIVFDGTSFGITSIAEIGRRRALELTCEALR